MIRISNIKMRPGHTREELVKKAADMLRVGPWEFTGFSIWKQSLDARKKPDLHYVYTVDVEVPKEKRVLERSRCHQAALAQRQSYQFPRSGTERMREKIVIIGSGPAGLFCGYFLAKHGYRPLILERGADVDTRVRDVEAFWRTGCLSETSNVQFGEGGAGTFSDGKLNTLVKDIQGRNRAVLEVFVKAGAPGDILYKNKPHIGTDVLRGVVKRMREQITEWGGEVRFFSQVTGLKIRKGAVEGVVVNGTEEILTQAVVLAVGHSARDTFSMLHKSGVEMAAKAFAVGLRMEHPQDMITRAQYGSWPEESSALRHLGAASYKVTAQTQGGRGVYSFCMCPGGYVVNASSEQGRLAINGMSNHARDGRNANSALIVTVTPEDFPGEGPLAGVAFQRELEEKAYALCQGKIPVQLYGDFRENRCSTALGEVKPDTKGAYAFGNLRRVLPEALSQALMEGIESFEHKIQGFSRRDAVLSGVESRTSSPVRIFRDERGESNVLGLYPCGEGAGYAGGITSAAMDGMRAAEKIAARYAPVKE